MAWYCADGGGTGWPGVPTVVGAPPSGPVEALCQLGHRFRWRLRGKRRLDGREAAVVGRVCDGQRGGFSFDVLRAVAGIRVAAQPLRATAAAARLPLDGLEHAGERAWVVTGTRHDLHAEQVGLLLEVATVPEEQRAEAELAGLPDRRSCRPADDRAAQGTRDLTELEPRILRLRGVRRAVPQQHVRKLVGHHAGDLGLGRRSIEHPAVDEHRSARQGECVDLLQVDGSESVLVDRLLEVGRRGGDEPVAQGPQVARDALVIDDRVLAPYLGGRLSSQLHVLLGRVAVLGQLDRRLRPQRGR